MAEEWTAIEANPTKPPKGLDALPSVEGADLEDIAQMSERDVSTLIQKTAAPERRMRDLFQTPPVPARAKCAPRGGLRSSKSTASRWFGSRLRSDPATL